MSISYAAISPIILPLAFVYFAFMAIVWRYQQM
jgi:hypothetical protein